MKTEIVEITKQISKEIYLSKHYKETNKILRILRKYIPKEYFRIVSHRVKNCKRTGIALKFKPLVKDGIIIEDITFLDYMRSKY